MEKKYQIFISSTFTDLKEERQSVSKSVLDLGHIPSGMELFPASNASQLEYIKKVIDDCDYYVLILGGRYGSVSSDGISFTEQEYNYALQTGVPVLAFVHHDIGDIKSKFVETEPALKERLQQFKAKVQNGRLVKFWSDVTGLQSSVITSLTAEFASNPRVGWRRADGQLSREALEKIEKLSQDNERYRDWWLKSSSKVNSYEDLSKSVLDLPYTLDGQTFKIMASGEEIMKEFASGLNVGLSTSDIHDGLLAIIRYKTECTENIEIPQKAISTTRLFFQVFEICNSDSSDVVQIKDDKKYLLKAAFKPLAEVMDEIPV
ncbi:DUF4062 domain-containing protein [Tabrizicola sp. WMC-M-20]|nr:DUF4062 domain-containing protein [Tabrizicola sp. WMC-M-20]